MAQLSPVVLKNAADVEVTFEPQNITNGVALLTKGNGVALSDERLTIAVSRTKDTNRTKVQFKFVVPEVQDAVINGLNRPTVVRTAYADLTVTFDASSTPSERADMFSYLSWLRRSAMIEKIILNNEGVY